MTTESRLAARLTNQGYSLFEIMLVVILLMVFIGIALRMFLNFAADAERMEMQEVLDSLQTSVMTVMSEHLIKDGLEHLESLDGTNPMRLLQKAPVNYAGELGSNDPRPDAGHWYFDRDRQVLIYLVKNDRFFSILENNKSNRIIEGKSEAIFKLIFNFADNNKNRKFDVDVDTAQGLELSPINDYQWTN